MERNDGHEETRFVPDRLILSVVVGSRAYGLQTADSDVDRRGVFAAPTPMFWRLTKPPTHVEGPLPEQFSWEVERFCALALEANPTVLECLWSPIAEHLTPQGEDLVAIRRAFLSRRAQQTFTGYAESQFRRLDPERPRWKQAMHMIRLLISGLHLAREGEPLVRMDEHRDRLLAVRRGEVPWGEVTRWQAELTEAVRGVGETGALPAAPDRRTVDDYLTGVRKAFL
ncbi:DNA polymerase beta superfamily protein [Planobispora siamensis]|uniref:Nucleotidyltransferase n=1 Tax=Planobispora siamensis TaxID=936338 RepID=A0A8J3WNI9_9ACTN|nr:nucleotidyltransferase domain-containing protein [Planobispora siamensis]GIH95885.1 nucleotidyltransferase [Planobispora siamensis]